MTADNAAPVGCPAWCQRDHPEDPGDAGSDHAADPNWVPVVMLRRTGDLGHRAVHATAVELIVALVHPSASAEPWIYIGEAEDTTVQIELSVGSARRLMRAIEDQLTHL